MNLRAEKMWVEIEVYAPDYCKNIMYRPGYMSYEVDH